jgi:hypothetical protein
MKGFPLDTPRSITSEFGRQDYEVDVAGRGRAAHLISDYIDVQGLLFPARRRVFMRNADGTLQFDKMPGFIDLSDFELS